MTETTKHKIAVLLAKYFLRSGRGKGLTARFTDIFRDILDGTVYLFAIKGFFNVVIDPKYLIGIVIIKSIAEYFLGYLDQIYGFWCIESEYCSRNINPFNEEMMKRIRNIEDKLS